MTDDMILDMADERFRDSYMGEWRFAGGSQPPVGGVFTVGDRLILRTPRNLEAQAGNQDDFTGGVILGDTLAGKITLLRCWSGANHANPLSDTGIGDVETIAQVMLIGDRHWDKESGRRFDRLTFRLTGLNSWMGRRPFKDRHDVDSGGVHFTRPSDVPFPVPSGKAVVRRTHSATSGVTIGCIESKEEIFIQLDRPQPFDDLYDRYIRPLRYFFDLATDEPCQASHIEVSNSKVLTSYGLPSPFAVRYQDEGEPERTRSLDNEMLFTLGNIELAMVIPAWFDLETKLDSACDLLFSLRERSKYYIPTRAFTAASAAEGMHWRLFSDRDTADHLARLDRIYQAVGEGPDQDWLKNKLVHSDITYAEMLNELVDEAGVAFAPFLGLDVKRWVRRVNDYRNVVAHNLKGVDKRPEQVVWLASTVELLLRIVLLRRLAFSEKECLRMIRRTRRWPYLRQVLPVEIPQVCSPTSSDGNPNPLSGKSA